MRKIRFLVIIISSMVIMSAQMNGQNVGIGADVFTPDNSALVEIRADVFTPDNSALVEIRGTKGLLIPRMTTIQRDSMSSSSTPAQSLLIFNTTTKCFETYVGNVWYTVWCELPCGNTVSYDGVTYNTVQIGNQCWFKENLRTTKYNDGTSITNITNASTWTSTTTGAYCCYSNSTSNCTTYGALYNWYAVTTGKLCPSGWHVPSDAEWKTLEMYLGMTQAQADATGWRGTDQGSKLAGNASLWTDGALDQNVNFGTSGFSALPGGSRNHSDGSFSSLGNYGYWWSSTVYDGSNAWYRSLYCNNANVLRYNYDKRSGFSVRCLRD